MGRSTAYWQTNLYPNPSDEPLARAPLKDLPPAVAARFRAVRDGLKSIPGVVEHVKFLGAQWRWAWEFTYGPRKLCWLHVMQESVSCTFTVSDAEERKAMATSRMPAVVLQAIEHGQRTGPVRWCWLEFNDRRTGDALVSFARKKAEWMRLEAPGGQLRRSIG